MSTPFLMIQCYKSVVFKPFLPDLNPVGSSLVGFGFPHLAPLDSSLVGFGLPHLALDKNNTLPTIRSV